MAEKIVSDDMFEDDHSFIVVCWIAAAFTDVVHDIIVIKLH